MPARGFRRRNPGVDEEFERNRLFSIEDEWLSERLRGEREITGRLLDDTYVGITSDGLPQTKAEFLQAITQPAGTAPSADHTERTINFYGDIALSTGIVTRMAPPRVRSYRYLRVFRNIDGEWRLIASQATRLKEV